MFELLKILEKEYKFNCEAGELKNCIDWQNLKSKVENLYNEIQETIDCGIPNEQAQALLKIFHEK